MQPLATPWFLSSRVYPGIRRAIDSTCQRMRGGSRHKAGMTLGWLVVGCMLSACASDYTPTDKVAGVDTTTGYAVPPYPCPDWSHNATVNYDNSLHSNYGCAVNNNLAVQLADPWDLQQGVASTTGNTDMGVRTIELYRAGELPASLQPQQSGAAQ